MLSHLLDNGLNSLQHLLGLDADSLGHVVCLVNAHHLVSQFEHVIPQGNDDELGRSGKRRHLLDLSRAMLASRLLTNGFLDVASDNRHVLVVQSSIDLIHAVQGRGLEDVQSEDQRERR